MKRFCLTLGLRNDPALIHEYIEYHREGWPEIHQSIRDAGVLDMQLYELDGRLFMIMDTTDDFSFERKARMDAANPPRATVGSPDGALPGRRPPTPIPAQNGGSCRRSSNSVSSVCRPLRDSGGTIQVSD